MEHSLFRERWLAAKEVYQQTKGAKKYTAACSELGLNTGKKEPKINNEAFFQDYLRLITTGDFDFDLDDPLSFKKTPNPLTKEEALENLAEKYGFETYNSAFQYMKRILKKKKKN